MQGNFDAFVKTRSELEENQMKRYQWERDQMQHMKVSHVTCTHWDKHILSSVDGESLSRAAGVNCIGIVGDQYIVHGKSILYKKVTCLMIDIVSFV